MTRLRSTRIPAKVQRVASVSVIIHGHASAVIQPSVGPCYYMTTWSNQA